MGGLIVGHHTDQNLRKAQAEYGVALVAGARNILYDNRAT